MKRNFTNAHDKLILRVDILNTSCGRGACQRTPLMISQHWLTTSHYITEIEMSPFWWNFHHWLDWKLSKWQLAVQPGIKILLKWHFRFRAEPKLTLRFIPHASHPHLVVLLMGSASNKQFAYVMVISNSCHESFYCTSDIKGTNSIADAFSLQPQQFSLGRVSSTETVILAFRRNFRYWLHRKLPYQQPPWPSVRLNDTISVSMRTNSEMPNPFFLTDRVAGVSDKIR